MRVVMRKFKEDKEWNVCGVFATDEAAEAECFKQIKSGREAKHFNASHVWIAENGNHSWTG